MMKPVILYETRFADGTLTATDTAAGYDVKNIIDYRTFTFWKAASAGTKYLIVDCGGDKSADALGIIGHNLKTANATVSIESSPDNAVWTERLAGFTPTSDKAFVKLFTQATARYWRLKIITSSVASYLAVALLGNKFQFERWLQDRFDPAPEKIEGKSSRSEKGHLLGSVVDFLSYDIQATWRHLTPSWVANTFKPVWDAHLAKLKPFIWTWDLDEHSGEVFFVKIADGFELQMPYDSIRRSLDLKFEGVKE